MPAVTLAIETSQTMKQTLNAPILIVDDTADNRELLAEMLQEQGYTELLMAENGQEALQVLEENPGVGLVLLDLMMPGMDGYETSRQISANPKTGHIPIIVVTGGAMRRDTAFVKSFASGAMDFILKPINEIELTVRVRSALMLFHERMLARKREREVIESNQRFDLAVSGANDGIWDCDLVKGELYVSPHALKLLGYEAPDVLNHPQQWNSLIHPDDQARVKTLLTEHLQNRTPFYACEYRLLTKSGEYKWVFCRGKAIWDEKGKPIRIAGSTTDITDRKQLETHLRNAQQMESIGRLAAGIAHDFNNLLTAIQGHASLVKCQLEPESPFNPSLISIVKASEHAAQLCKQMLTYSGKVKFQTQEVEVNNAIREMSQILNVSLRKNTGLRLDLSPKTFVSKLDPAQFQQIILNLTLNAAEAIGDAPGVVTIRTDAVDMRPEDLTGMVIAPRAQAGRFIRIRITDNGCGMSPETMAKIFEPFFTTKFSGRGLGLATVMGIVKALSGGLQIESRLQAGSTFTLLFPMIKAAKAPVPPVMTDDKDWKSSGTVLLVDDEEKLREICALLLGELGFDVITAVDGTDALKRFESDRHNIDIVLLDVTMPGISGIEVYKEIRKNSDVPVLFTSGYTEKSTDQFKNDPKVGFLQKPFTLDVLASKMKKFLQSLCLELAA